MNVVELEDVRLNAVRSVPLVMHGCPVNQADKESCHEAGQLSGDISHVGNSAPLGEIRGMAGTGLSPAKAVLLAVQLTCKSDLAGLRTLVSQHRKTLHNELVLRILLSHLPESLDSSKYVPFFEDLISGRIVEDSKTPVDSPALIELTELEAQKKVRKLHLLPLAWPNCPADAPADPIVLFLIHRALRIDENTGLLTQLPSLLAPFLHYSDYLRTWMISTILPLVRYNYDYHSDDGVALTIAKFEALDDRAGVSLLLSKTGIEQTTEPDPTIGRDLKGLVGPWLYGDTRWKRRKLRKTSSFSLQSLERLDEVPAVEAKYAGWEEVFKWLSTQARTSWKTAVEAVEQWDGPGDLDLGGYEDGTIWRAEDDEMHLERRYARSGLAAAYLISEESEEALNGVQRILARIITLLDKDRIPSLQAGAALLSPVSGLEDEILSPKSATCLRNDLLEEHNILTTPNEQPLKMLHALLISAFLCTRAGCSLSVRRAGELVFLQDEFDQRFLFSKLMSRLGDGPKSDDKYWTKIRNEILWLRSWGADEPFEGTESVKGKGVFGQLPRESIEAELIKALLANTRYTLARSIYETSPDRPLAKKALHDAIISAAMNAYDNATNANRTRGGVKKCNDILQAFPDTLDGSLDKDQLEHLITVTHFMGSYRLVFKQGEPFKPVSLRVHGDPISIIGKILDQNPRSYTKIGDFIDMGKHMVRAGLTVRNVDGQTALGAKQAVEEEDVAEKRVVSMCIDAALAEDDFETAYSYVVTRLKVIAGPAHAPTPMLERRGTGLFAEPPPRVIDNWSWRAALQAGKYRRTSQTIKPTHLGNSSGNPEIRHLEQRMDCLSQALRIAPKGQLQEILNVYRRCEEELESHIKREAEQEEEWDAQGDEQIMPGGYAAAPAKKTSSSRATEEAPMSLFDLSRASMARAQNGFSALSMLKGNNTTSEKSRNVSRESTGSGGSTLNSSTDSMQRAPIRKRDQLKNAAVGGLASGVGWLIGAPPVIRDDKEHGEQ